MSARTYWKTKEEYYTIEGKCPRRRMIQFRPAKAECVDQARDCKCKRNGNKHRALDSWENLCASHFIRDMVSCVPWNSRGCSGMWATALQGHNLRGNTTRMTSGYAQSWLPPRLRCFPGKSTSGCTTRMWRVNASLREKVFSSTQSAQRTFCLRALCIVSS
jgi:hypothetical protein